MGELEETVVNMSPAEIAKLRGKRQNLSSRDQQLHIKTREGFNIYA
jgi:hypothetical protein